MFIKKILTAICVGAATTLGSMAMAQGLKKLEEPDNRSKLKRKISKVKKAIFEEEEETE